MSIDKCNTGCEAPYVSMVNPCWINRNQRQHYYETPRDSVNLSSKQSSKQNNKDSIIAVLLAAGVVALCAFGGRFPAVKKLFSSSTKEISKNGGIKKFFQNLFTKGSKSNIVKNVK